MARCGTTAAHAAHGGCPGRAKCVKCGRLAWADELVVIREHRVHNGKLRHRGCLL